MEDELIGQMRETGGSVTICDLCGRPATSVRRVIVSGRGFTGDSVEELGACAACERLLEADELPVDTVTDTERRLSTEK